MDAGDGMSYLGAVLLCVTVMALLVGVKWLARARRAASVAASRGSAPGDARRSGGRGAAISGAPPEAEAFLRARRIAIASVSAAPTHFTRMLARDLERRGYQVVRVHRDAQELDGRPCFQRVRDAWPPPDGVLVVASPGRSQEIVRDALLAGARQVWLHRGAGPGAGTDAAIAACREGGVQPVTDLCPYMVLPGAGPVHRIHGCLRRLRRGR